MLQERGLVTDDAPAAVGNEESVTEEVAVEAKPKKAKAKKE
jgi:hypothetical protein